jgi:hypothetical protein
VDLLGLLLTIINVSSLLALTVSLRIICLLVSIIERSGSSSDTG